jgi:hypothetical protein
MLNDITIEWTQITLFSAAGAALLTAAGLQLWRVKAQGEGLTGAAKTGIPVPKIVGAPSTRPTIRSFVPKIVGVSQFKKSAQIKYGQACATSQRLLMAMRREMASHGVTPPDENPA